jgi:tetratricopeptide (TPR) repeat protein
LLLERRGRLDEAVEEYRRTVALKPDCAEANYDLGNALTALQQLSDAIAAFRRAIELKPDFAEAYCNLAAALRQRGDFVEALEAMEQGHALGSQRPDWHYPSALWVIDYRLLVEQQARTTCPGRECFFWIRNKIAKKNAGQIVRPTKMPDKLSGLQRSGR